MAERTSLYKPKLLKTDAQTSTTESKSETKAGNEPRFERDIGEYLHVKYSRVNQQLASSSINSSLTHAIVQHTDLSSHQFSHAQFDVNPSASSIPPDGSISVSLFAGIRCWVDGLTSPPVAILNKLICSGGGVIEMHPGPRVTHILASTLPLSKVKALASMRVKPWVVRAEWVVACVRAYERVAELDYTLDCVRHLYARTHPVHVMFQTHTHGVHTTNTATVVEDQASTPVSELCMSWVMVRDYLHASRLHFIGSWKERHLHAVILPRLHWWTQNHTHTHTQDVLEDVACMFPDNPVMAFNHRVYHNHDNTHIDGDMPWSRNAIVRHHLPQFPDLAVLLSFPCPRIDAPIPAQSSQHDSSLRSDPYGVCFHIDMDSFFVNAAIAHQYRADADAVNTLDLYSTPVAIAHGAAPTQSSSSSASSSSSSTSSISSCNSVARAFGVYANMSLSSASALGPVVTLPYQFQAYTHATELLYGVLAALCVSVAPIGIDECFVACDADSLLAAHHLYRVWVSEDVSETDSHPQPHTGTETRLDLACLWFARLLRSWVLVVTQCVCSVGAGPNNIIARIATQFAKPLVKAVDRGSVDTNSGMNMGREVSHKGQVYLLRQCIRQCDHAYTEHGVCVPPLLVALSTHTPLVQVQAAATTAHFLSLLAADVLPGVGGSTAAKLRDNGFSISQHIQTCRSDPTRFALLSTLVGTKTAETLCQASVGARGDNLICDGQILFHRVVDPLEARSSVSAVAQLLTTDESAVLAGWTICIPLSTARRVTAWLNRVLSCTHTHAPVVVRVSPLSPTQCRSLPASASVEMTWGVRPDGLLSVDSLVQALVRTILNKLTRVAGACAVEAGWVLETPLSVACTGMSVTVMTRSADAPPPSKYMGHGRCDSTSKSEKHTFSIPISWVDFHLLARSTSSCEPDPTTSLHSLAVCVGLVKKASAMVRAVLVGVLTRHRGRQPTSADVDIFAKEVRGVSVSVTGLTVANTTHTETNSRSVAERMFAKHKTIPVAPPTHNPTTATVPLIVATDTDNVIDVTDTLVASTAHDGDGRGHGDGDVCVVHVCMDLSTPKPTVSCTPRLAPGDNVVVVVSTLSHTHIQANARKRPKPKSEAKRPVLDEDLCWVCGSPLTYTVKLTHQRVFVCGHPACRLLFPLLVPTLTFTDTFTMSLAYPHLSRVCGCLAAHAVAMYRTGSVSNAHSQLTHTTRILNNAIDRLERDIIDHERAKDRMLSFIPHISSTNLPSLLCVSSSSFNEFTQALTSHHQHAQRMLKYIADKRLDTTILQEWKDVLAKIIEVSQRETGLDYSFSHKNDEPSVNQDSNDDAEDIVIIQSSNLDHVDDANLNDGNEPLERNLNYQSDDDSDVCFIDSNVILQSQ